jgi:hypothetical protein
MKIRRVLLTSLIFTSLVTTQLFADYNKGYKYYTKYIKRKIHISGTSFIKLLGVKDQAELDKLFENNAKDLIKKLKQIKEIIKNSKNIPENQINKKEINLTSLNNENNISINNNELKIIKDLNLTTKNIDKIIKNIKKLIKKKKIENLKDFLDGLMQGKIPAGC